MKKLCFIFFLCNAYILFGVPTELSFTLPFTVTGLANATTFFMHDALQHNFILKYHPRGPKRAIHDTLGAYIGTSIGMRINQVELFSANHKFNQLFSAINPLNSSQIGITTLHTRVPGVAVRGEIKTMNDEISIKRGIRKQKTLNNITKYQELCDIVAFDIFIDNSDRHNGNLFFDAKTGHFYAIDMDHGFKSAFTLAHTPHEYDFATVASKTYRFVKTLKKKDLSHKEIAALKQVQQTLQLFVALYSPAVLFEEWMLLAQKADVLYNQREQEKIKKYLEYNVHEVERLIVLLDGV